MSLNRSTYWTMLTGEQARVKHMTIGEMQRAIMQIDDMEFTRLSDDPYIIQQMCSCGEVCNVLPTIVSKKDGFLLEDWAELFRDEIVKRLKLVAGQALRQAPKVVKVNFLVKWFKIW